MCIKHVRIYLGVKAGTGLDGGLNPSELHRESSAAAADATNAGRKLALRSDFIHLLLNKSTVLKASCLVGFLLKMSSFINTFLLFCFIPVFSGFQKQWLFSQLPVSWLTWITLICLSSFNAVSVVLDSLLMSQAWKMSFRNAPKMSERKAAAHKETSRRNVGGYQTGEID